MERNQADHTLHTISLNLRGTNLEIGQDILLKFEEDSPFIQKLCSNSGETITDILKYEESNHDRKSYYVNKNPSYFHHILDFLDGKQGLHFPHNICTEVIQGQLLFYGLDVSCLGSCCRDRLLKEQELHETNERITKWWKLLSKNRPYGNVVESNDNNNESTSEESRNGEGLPADGCHQKEGNPPAKMGLNNYQNKDIDKGVAENVDINNAAGAKLAIHEDGIEERKFNMKCKPDNNLLIPIPNTVAVDEPAANNKENNIQIINVNGESKLNADDKTGDNISVSTIADTEDKERATKKLEDALLMKKRQAQERVNTIRENMWYVLERPASSVFAKIWVTIAIAVITTSVLTLILETERFMREPGYDEVISQTNITLGNGLYKFYVVNSLPKDGIVFIDTVCTVILSVEYVLRLIVNHRRMKFITRPLNVIDLLGVAPMWIHFCIVLGGKIANYNRPWMQGIMDAMSFFRLCRILRFGRIMMLNKQLRIVLLAVIYSWQELCILGSIILVSSTVFGSVIYYIEQDNDTFQTIFRAMWWSVITMTTVGYGDYYPETEAGYLVGILCSLCGIVLIALATTIIVNYFLVIFSAVEAYERTKTDLKQPVGFELMSLANMPLNIVSKIKVNNMGNMFRRSFKSGNGGTPRQTISHLGDASSNTFTDIMNSFGKGNIKFSQNRTPNDRENHRNNNVRSKSQVPSESGTVPDIDACKHQTDNHSTTKIIVVKSH